MQISATSPTRQRLGRIAAVSALALLLAGSIATPAGAMKRSQVVRIVNGAIGLCFSSGGYPDVEESPVNGGFSVACYWDDGSSAWGWYDYEDEDQGEPPVRGRPDSRSARAADSVTANDTGSGASDAADHGRQKAHKQKKHKSQAGKHGHKHRR
jgi:hypothetical protein